MQSITGAGGVLPKAMFAARRTLMQSMPHGAYDVLRDALWHRGVLQMYKAHYVLSTGAGKSYEAAPPLYLCFQYGTTDPARYMQHGRDSADVVSAALERAGVTIPSGAKVLDFGCGCGRVMQAFSERWQVHGCDIKADAIRWIEQYRPSWPVALTRTSPPLPETFGDFALVYALSVFTHMDEVSVHAWFAHLHQRLAPGGVLLMTVVDPRTASFRERFGVTDTVGDATDFHYHAPKKITFISESYLRSLAAGRFELLSMSPWDSNQQTVAVLQKLGPVGAVADSLDVG